MLTTSLASMLLMSLLLGYWFLGPLPHPLYKISPAPPPQTVAVALQSSPAVAPLSSGAAVPPPPCSQGTGQNQKGTSSSNWTLAPGKLEQHSFPRDFRCMVLLRMTVVLPVYVQSMHAYIYVRIFINVFRYGQFYK
jgi:hypothetical protein